MHARPWRRRAATVTALAALLLATGCGFFTPEEPGSDEPSASAASGSSDDASDDASEGASASDDPSSDTDPIASLEFSAADSGTNIPLRFDLLALERRGDLLELRGSITNTSTELDDSWQVADALNGEKREDLDTQSGTFSGVYLTDQRENKRYFVAADSSKNCVCTSDLTSAFIGGDQTLQLSATFAAPPEATTSLDVQITGIGNVDDVPVG